MISNYAELQTNVIRWLGRTTDPELPSLVPVFIYLFESVARRRLKSRVGEIRSVNSTIINEYTQLPADFIKPVSVKRIAPTPGPMKLKTDATLSALPQAVGVPELASVSQRSLRLYPVPSGTTIIQLTYTRLPGLGVAAGLEKNWLLDLAPDVYLFGALAQAAEHYEDERKEGWEAKSYALLDDINQSSKASASSDDLEPTVMGNVV